MKAIVYKVSFKVAVEDVFRPEIQRANDAIVRISTAAICGSDRHIYGGRTSAKPGVVFGHDNLVGAAFLGEDQ
jgi:glutathione-independent formaldehyde dehydrogenase